MAPDGPPTDARLALILRRLGAGGTITAAGVDAGITRKTIGRWRSPGAWCVSGFGEACDRVTELAALGTVEARAEIEQIVLAWAVSRHQADDVFDGPAEPGPADLDDMTAPVADPDVLDAGGREIVTSRRAPPQRPAPADHLSAEQLYPKRRAPTKDEWFSMMADLATDPLQPASVRCAAIASGNAEFARQAQRRSTADQPDPGIVEAARERGREPGVPASVWQEARQNFLGPAPEPEAEADTSGDVVEFERPASPGSPSTSS